MGRMNRLKAKANKHFKTTERMQSNGVKTGPMKACKTDHHRVGDAWRHRKSKDEYRGARGKQKIMRGPRQPI